MFKLERQNSVEHLVPETEHPEASFNGSQLAFLTCPCHIIYREVVDLKSSNYTLKIMIFVHM